MRTWIEKSRLNAFKTIIVIATGFLSLNQSGCFSGKSEESWQVNRALQREEKVSRIVIGRRDGTSFDYLNMKEGGRITTLQGSSQETVPISIDPRQGSNVSSDGTWKTECTQQTNCNVTQLGNTANSFHVSLQDLLTPLYWSPDANFVFYVRKAPVWRLPPRCSFDDERDVIVRDVTEHRESVVSTVCAGYPYGALRWYRLTH
jgi:hypothetical protein